MIFKAFGKVATLVKCLFNAVYMQRCYLCGASSDFFECICAPCRARLGAALHEPVQVYDVRASCRLYVLSSYATQVGDCIKLIKYRPSKRLLGYFRRWLAKKNYLVGFLGPHDVLVPVPMGAARQAKRGFNQSAELARYFAKRYGCSYSEPLVRLKAVKAQAECQEEERLTNLEGVFGLSERVVPGAFKGKRLIIFDDVATTGTTINKCAEALKALEPAEIIGLAITHSYKISGRSK